MAVCTHSHNAETLTPINSPFSSKFWYQDPLFLVPLPHLSKVDLVFWAMATDLDRLYGCTAKPSSVLNFIFMSIANMARKMLISTSSSKAENTEKWKLTDHLRFMVMLISWLMLWVLRFFMDLFSCSMISSPDYHLGGSSSVRRFQLSPYSSSATEEALPSCGLILRNRVDVDGLAVKALVKALTHVSLQLHTHHP